MDAVTSIILERERDRRSLRPMVVLSTVVHVVVLGALVLGQGRLFGVTGEPQPVMTITIGGGGTGPYAGGANPIGGRPIQREVAEPSARPEAVRPPAAKTPEMTEPIPGKKPAREKFGEVKSAPSDATGRTPTTGPRERFGTSAAETGGYGFGSGLSTGGGGGMGGRLDVSNFCCPDYLETMVMRIQRNWESAQGIAGQVIIKFTIQRDGSITGIELERSSGYPGLDLTAQRALLNTRQLPPLPAAYPNPVLTLHLNFDYKR